MDVEKTIEFILDSQARTVSWQENFERKHDATIKMIKAGMKILAKHDNSIKELTVSPKALTGTVETLTGTVETLTGTVATLEHSVEELGHSVGDLRFSHQTLIDAQMRTDEKLNRLIDSLSKQHPNGH